jgi:HSP20 family protein
LLRNLERCVDEAFAELIHGPWRAVPVAAGWQPAIEVRETADEYLVLVDLPGIWPEDVSVHVENHTLVVHGKRSSQRQGQVGAVVYTECVQGEFLRRVPLPGVVDEAQFQTSFAQGLLLVTFSKRRAAGAKTARHEET